MKDQELRDKVKSLIVTSTRLKIPPSELGDDQPLLGGDGGLNLDSIDILEVVVGLEKAFGVSIPDRETGQRVLQSVSTIVAFIKQSGGVA